MTDIRTSDQTTVDTGTAPPQSVQQPTAPQPGQSPAPSTPGQNSAQAGQPAGQNPPAQAQPTQPNAAPSNQPDADTKAGASIPANLVNNPSVPTQRMAFEADANKTSVAPHHSWIHSAAQALAGGPRYTYQVDDGGNMVKTEVPVSTAHLGLAIALEALKGAAAGAGEHGPGAVGRAAADGLKQGEQTADKLKQDDQQARQNAQEDSAYKQKLTEANMRNYQLAMNVGTQSKEVSQALPDSYRPITDAIDNGTINLPGIQRMWESDAAASVQNGKTNVTNSLLIPYGDAQPLMEGGKQKVVNGIPVWGHNYMVIPNATNAKVTLTDQMQKEAQKIGLFTNADGTPAQIGQPQWSLADLAQKMSLVAQVKTGEQLLQLHKNDAHDVLGRPSEDLDDLPGAVRKDPAMKTALAQFSKMAGVGSIDTILGQMNKVDPQSASVLMQYLKLTPKDMTDMDDQRKANTKKAETAFDPDKAPASAALVSSFPADIKKSYPGLTSGQVDSLTKQLGKNPSQKDYEAAQNRAHTYDDANTNRSTKQAAQGGKNIEALLNYGVDPENPSNKLTIDSPALPGGMLVNSRTGQPIPLKMLTTVKPSQSEINREQFADSAIESMGKLNELISQAEAKTGPITGRLDTALAKAGLGDKFTQELLNYTTFAQSAATGAHVGGRFSVPIMGKMETVINPNMNKDQLQGAMYSIKSVMQNYKDNGGRFTVDEWRSMPQEEKQRLTGRAAASQSSASAPTFQKYSSDGKWGYDGKAWVAVGKGR